MTSGGTTANNGPAAEDAQHGGDQKEESTPMIPANSCSEAAEDVTTTASGNSMASSADMNGTTASDHHTRAPSENSHLLAHAMKLPLRTCRTMLGDRALLVDTLAILFGIGSWVGVNSIYLQLPLLVAHAPEGWSLPSFLVIIIQIANVGPLLYTLMQRCSPRKLNDTHLIYAIYAIGVVSSVCLASMYTWTAFVAGEERSVALLAITFFFALIGCTSSVLFMPYMGRFKEIYLITYLVGEGLSGFLPSLLALAQGVGGNTVCVPSASADGGLMPYTPPPRFQSDVFFYCIFALMTISGVAFVLLGKLQVCRREYASAVTIRHGNDYNYGDASGVATKQPRRSSCSKHDGDDAPLPDELDLTRRKLESTLEDASAARDEVDEVKKLSPANYVGLMFVMAVVSMFGSGIFPSVQSYSCLPYGNQAYHLAVTMSSIANPAACFAAVFLPHKSIRSIGALCGLMLVLTAYALATALLSPEPPLVQTVIGEVLVVITWVGLTGLVSFIKLSITSIFRYEGGQSLVWIGAISQAGSAVGAVISFCLVNMTGIFVAYQQCSST